MKSWKRIQDKALFIWTLILNYLNVFFCLQSPYLKGVTIVRIARNDVQFANLHSYSWCSLHFFLYILYLNLKTVISACIRFKTNQPSRKSKITCSCIVDENIEFMYCIQLFAKCKWTIDPTWSVARQCIIFVLY